MQENEQKLQKQIEALKEQIEIFEHVMASTDVHFTVHDRHGHFVYVNPAGLAAQNLRLEDVAGKNWRELGFPEEIGVNFDKQVEQVFTEGVTLRDETVFPTVDGPRIFQNIFQPAYDKNGNIVAMVATRQDITEKRRIEEALRISNEEMEKLATIDHLTKLYNRRHFFELAEQELIRAKRYNLNFSLLLIDLDKFKTINDSFGHLFGDQVLQIAAESVRQNSREIDILGRYGGDEFAILAPETQASQSQIFASRMRQSFQNQIKELIPKNNHATMSIGIADFQNQNAISSIDTIFEQADQALYNAKGDGGNRIHIWPGNG